MKIVYDGTYFGFLNALKKAVFENCEIGRQEDDLLFSSSFNLKTDINEAKEFEKQIFLLSPKFLENIRLLWLSQEKNFEEIAAGYLKQAFKYKKEALNNISDFYVSKTNKIAKSVLSEAHKFKGFVRFKEIDKNTLFAKIDPDYNILPLIKNHFEKRLKAFNFMIYDEKRNIAIVKKGKTCEIVEVKDVNFKETEQELEIQNLWKKFFKSVAITERKNEKLQKSKVPLKYRKNLIEFSN